MTALWRLLAAMVWLGVLIAGITVVAAVALVSVLGAIVYGLISPTRTPASTLRSLAANAAEGIAHVRALRT